MLFSYAGKAVEVQEMDKFTDAMKDDQEMLRELHDETLMMRWTIEDHEGYVGDNPSLYADGDRLEEGMQLLTGLMLDAFGFEYTSKRQQNLRRFYENHRRYALVQRGVLPEDVLDDDEDAEGEIH